MSESSCYKNVSIAHMACFQSFCIVYGCIAASCACVHMLVHTHTHTHPHTHPHACTHIHTHAHTHTHIHTHTHVHTHITHTHTHTHTHTYAHTHCTTNKAAVHCEVGCMMRRDGRKNSPIVLCSWFKKTPLAVWSCDICMWAITLVQALNHFVLPHRYHSFFQTFATVWREERFRGLYGGLGTHLIRVVPNSAIVFFTYEAILKLADQYK